MHGHRLRVCEIPNGASMAVLEVPLEQINMIAACSSHTIFFHEDSRRLTPGRVGGPRWTSWKGDGTTGAEVPFSATYPDRLGA